MSSINTFARYAANARSRGGLGYQGAAKPKPKAPAKPAPKPAPKPTAGRSLADKGYSSNAHYVGPPPWSAPMPKPSTQPPSLLDKPAPKVDTPSVSKPTFDPRDAAPAPIRKHLKSKARTASTHGGLGAAVTGVGPGPHGSAGVTIRGRFN